MATFRKRGDSWRVEVARKGHRESASFDTRAQAAAWAAEIEAALAGGTRGPVTSKTLSDALKRFGEDVSPKRKGKRWELVRLARLRRTMKCVHLKLSDVGPEHVAQFRDDRLKEVKPGSVARELTLLSAVFQVAVTEWRWCKTNPCHGVKPPGKPPHRDRLIAPAETALLLQQLDYAGGAPTTLQHEVAIALLLALETGMRASEILGLTAAKIHFAERYLDLPKTKNGDKRQVPLSAEAIRLLKLMPGKDRLFTLKSGTLDVYFRAARDALKLKGLQFRDSRHTAVTRLAKKLDVLDLAKMIGHRDPKSLMVYYNPSATDIAAKLD